MTPANLNEVSPRAVRIKDYWGRQLSSPVSPSVTHTTAFGIVISVVCRAPPEATVLVSSLRISVPPTVAVMIRWNSASPSQASAILIVEKAGSDWSTLIDGA